MGDVFFIVMITIGFGVVMAVGTLYGMLAALLPLKAMLCLAEHRDRQPGHRVQLIPGLQGKGTNMLSAFLLAVFLLLIFAMLEKGTSNSSAARTFAFFPILGFFLLFMFGTRWPTGQVLAPLSRALLAVVLTVAVVGAVHPALLDFTMTIVGIRSEPSAVIVVNKAEHVRLEELAHQNGMDVHFCALPNADSWATRDARAIWHNIGERSYIRLLDRATRGQRNLRVPIERKNLDVIGTEGTAPICNV
ncbi:hypothetical protein C2I33_20730 [Ralstonia solanacearum]|uniref:hypothetical protein n=1 Tax=Ralstonia solanacearum TaxID=305 RepID=UPI0005AC3528|nr:hypothetical protein [Ralstonia solanacearum]MDC6180467.1 hypothetical protein [Ralstonia solanacearum]MDC6213135.1 hypothetical protein [Ralstonia solanacearum]MDC6242062.1 hypothetical protein [Ralstonia solanacearum]MDD7803746.1 hypothetical protein [Ralstonia solanacearum]TYZ52972.1 hypothetical protein C2I33_20730 [Ralstonia solanacearum]